MMKKLSRIYYVIFISFISFFAGETLWAQSSGSSDKLVLVPVGEAQLAKEKLTVNTVFSKETLSKDQENLLNDVRAIIINDFAFYQKYFLVSDAKDKTFDDKKDFYFLNPSYDSWLGNKTDYLIQLRGEKFGNRLRIWVYYFNIRKKQTSFKKELTLASGGNPGNYRKDVHQISGEIYKQITGKDSIFNSSILFVSDLDSTKGKVIKELYMMDFDGRNVRKMTNHKGIVISPSFSKDNRYILYSLIKDPKYGDRNVEMHMLDTQTLKSTMVSNRKGINSGAIFMGDNDHIALTLSFSGNAEIYVQGLKDGSLRPLTKHFTDNVDPALSPDGKSLAFISGRAGKAMVYTLDVAGTEKDVKRLSYVGQFHSTPVYSPDSKYIAFASWVDGCFDLYRLDTTGSEIVRLTKNFGCNENPSFSTDSEFIVFSNQRVITRTEAEFVLYIMDKDGEIIAPISKGLGRSYSPRWSN